MLDLLCHKVTIDLDCFLLKKMTLCHPLVVVYYGDFILPPIGMPLISEKIKPGTRSVLGRRAVMRKQRRTSLSFFGYKLSRAQSQYYYGLCQF